MIPKNAGGTEETVSYLIRCLIAMINMLGRLVTVFVSSIDKEPIEKLAVDTITLYPNNSLMVVADQSELGKITDTVPTHVSKKREIYPAFVVRQAGEQVSKKVSEKASEKPTEKPDSL